MPTVWQFAAREYVFDHALWLLFYLASGFLVAYGLEQTGFSFSGIMPWNRLTGDFNLCQEFSDLQSVLCLRIVFWS